MLLLLFGGGGGGGGDVVLPVPVLVRNTFAIFDRTSYRMFERFRTVHIVEIHQTVWQQF